MNTPTNIPSDVLAELQNQLAHWHDEAEKFGGVIKKISLWAHEQHEGPFVCKEGDYVSLRTRGPCDCATCIAKRRVLTLIAENL